MVQPRRRRPRRRWPVFAASLVAHVAVFSLFATDTFRPAASPVEYVQSATPVEIVPRLKLAPRPRPERKRRAAPPRRPSPAPADLVSEPPKAIADEQLHLSQGQTSPVLAPPPELPDVAPAEASAQGGAGGAYPINPGYWEVVEHWPFIDRTERYCVEPKNITTFMAAPCNHIYHCVYPVQSIEDGRLHFIGMISKHDENYRVRGEGTYSPTALRLSVRLVGHWRMLPFVFLASLDGRYLGADCPADAKRIRQNR
jgi:hypothetical protein